MINSCKNNKFGMLNSPAILLCVSMLALTSKVYAMRNEQNSRNGDKTEEVGLFRTNLSKKINKKKCFCDTKIVTQNNNLPKLNFEQTCPDSSDFKPNFKFENLEDPYFQKLRTKFKLDELVKNCSTELEKVLVITNWVSHLWEHNGWNIATKPDAFSILQEVIEQKKQFRCVEYSIVTNGCLNAIGIQSRILGLSSSDVETRKYGAGHIVIEAYLKNLNKWIMVDAQANAIPVLNNIPLNAVEFQKALANHYSCLNIISLSNEITFKEYVEFIGQYLYYFKTELEQKCTRDGDQKSIMLVPIGAKKPTVFQIKYPLINVLYTHSAACFYQKPEANQEEK